MQAREIIDPETHNTVLIECKLARKPPTHTDVAKVIDDAAEDIPAMRH